MFNLVGVKVGVLGENVLKQQPQPGNFPLPVFKVIDITSYRFPGLYLKGCVEGTVGAEYFQVGIQDQKRFMHGFDYILGIDAGFLSINLGTFEPDTIRAGWCLFTLQKYRNTV